MSIIYLGLGSNSPDQQEMLRRARILLNIFIGPLTGHSRLYNTDPWGMPDQPQFTNQVVKIATFLTPSETYNSIEQIEEILKKHKTSKNGPRNIDIDLLLFEDHIVNKKGLEIPHPRMHKRNFVLIPLAEIAPDLIHPVTGKSISELVKVCKDKGGVQPIKNHQ